MKKNLFLISMFAACAAASPGATYLETVDGDLSDDYLAPTPLVLSAGSNLLTGSMLGSTLDYDLFTLIVPAGHELSAIRILEFSGGGAASFLGLQPGVTLSADPDLGDSFPDPIGYALISPGDAAGDEDVLDTIVVGPPFSFTNPLPAGSYAGWLNENGPPSAYGIDFFVTVVPEPSTALLGCVSVLAWMAFRRR